MTNDQFLAEVKKKAKSVYIYQTLKFPGLTLKGTRKFPEKRIHLIEQLALKGKTVYDLGCANGFMSFEIAKRGASVKAFDVLEDRLNFAQFIADHYRYDIEFINASITPEMIRALSPVDCVIFLSVMHHIYRRKKVDPIGYCRDLISEISKVAEILVFEIGQNGEPFPWATQFNMMEDDPKTWILENWFHGTEYTNIEVIDPPLFNKTPLGRLKRKIVEKSRRTSLHYPLYRIEKPTQWVRFLFKRIGCLINGILYRIFISDPRDTRYLFIARKG
jgi:SAM-dependent methyltransferase